MSKLNLNNNEAFEVLKQLRREAHSANPIINYQFVDSSEIQNAAQIRAEDMETKDKLILVYKSSDSMDIYFRESGTSPKEKRGTFLERFHEGKVMLPNEHILVPHRGKNEKELADDAIDKMSMNMYYALQDMVNLCEELTAVHSRSADSLKEETFKNSFPNEASVPELS